MITRTTRACASYPSCVAVATRAIPNRDVFYVARARAAPFASGSLKRQDRFYSLDTITFAR